MHLWNLFINENNLMLKIINCYIISKIIKNGGKIFQKIELNDLLINIE